MISQSPLSPVPLTISQSLALFQLLGDDEIMALSVLGADEISALMNDGIMAHIGGGGIAVESSGKAATTWAHLKDLE
jgi:hypothetical protein